MYNAEETRKRILDCAIRLFAQKGLKATSVADIVAAAGCSKGACFYHFSSKDMIIEAAFQYCHNAIEDAASEGVAELPSVVDKFCRRCYNLTRHAILYPDEATVNAMYLNAPEHYAQYGHGYRAAGRHFIAVNEMVEQGIANGELKEMPALLLGEMFFSIAAVPYTYMRNNPEAFEKREYWDDIYEIIRCAMAKKP